MNFYHYTCPASVLSISGHGLRARATDDNAIMTGGVPVVWLTRQESNLMTESDVAYCGWSGVPAEECAKLGEPIFGGTARLAVRIERHNKRLMKYRDFLAACDCHKDIATRLAEAALSQWYVYLGDIAPSKIDASLPAPLMIECLDHHIATHPNWDTRRRFVAIRKQVATLQPDRRVGFSPTSSCLGAA